jgi:hypothetical protein
LSVFFDFLWIIAVDTAKNLVRNFDTEGGIGNFLSNPTLALTHAWGGDWPT